MGRPTEVVRGQRRKRFIALLAAGHGWRLASDASGYSAEAVLDLLDEDEFWTVAKALREGRADLAAVAIAPTVEAQAA